MDQEKNMVASLALHAVLEPVFSEVSAVKARLIVTELGWQWYSL